MPVLVHKYGGTSVGTVERIRAVADRVLAAQRTGHHMVVVVSAMGQHTDDLLTSEQIRRVRRRHHRRHRSGWRR